VNLSAKSKRLIKRTLLRCRVPQLLSRLGRPSVIVLRYHSVQQDPTSFAHSIGNGIIHSASVFEKQIELVARRFRPVTIDEVLQFLCGEKRMPRRAVAITFDDGFRDNHEIVAPILNRYGVPAAFYVTVGSIAAQIPPWFCRLRHAFHSTKKREWTDPFMERRWDLTNADGRNEARLRATWLCATLVGDRRSTGRAYLFD